MKNVRWLPAAAILFVCVPLFAQNQDDAAVERQRKITAVAESMISDARQLGLPENRAFVFANIGNRLWEVDPKRAQDLFEDSITELLAAQAEAEAERRKGRQGELLTSGSTRPHVLRTIAARNAEFALKGLYRSRPSAVETAILNANPKDSKIRSMTGGDAYLVQNELNLEQWLMRTAAEQSPERAVALLQAALKKGVGGDTLNLLKKLHEKNPAAAAEMGSEVVWRLLAKGFISGTQVDQSATQAALSFLAEHVRQRPPTDRDFRFNPGEMRSLADKLITFFYEKGSQFGYGYGQQLIPIAEKMRPDAVAKIRELDRNTPRHGLWRNVDSDYSRLTNPETPIEQVLAEAPKISPEMRPQVYQSAAGRLVAAGETARARQILSDNFSDEALAEAQTNLNWHVVQNLINQGKFGDAEALIDQMPETTRFSAMISLSDAAFNRDSKENRSFSLGIISKAAAGIPLPLENSTDLQQIMQIIAAYSRVEPNEAFRIFEGIVPQLNELNEAAVVINAFNASQNSRRGELTLSNGGVNSVYIDGSVLRGLSQKDFDRAWTLIGTFSRREIRITFKQQILETL